MSIIERARARREKMDRERPRVKVTWNADGTIQWPQEKEKEQENKPASNIRRFVLPTEAKDPEVGAACNHCGGSGKYLIHTKRVWGKCYRCDGKGVLADNDLALLALRRRSNAPICRIYGGI